MYILKCKIAEMGAEISSSRKPARYYPKLCPRHTVFCSYETSQQVVDKLNQK